MLLAVVFSFLSSASAFQIPTSAVRPHGVNAFNVLDRWDAKNLEQLSDGAKSELAVYSRISEAEALQTRLQEVADLETLAKLFNYVRDSRTLRADKEFPRRPSWMFPDDGCFARAEVASQELIKMGHRPSKIFAYGNLQVKTQNSPAQMVEWWYHVVVAFRVGKVNYVLDPAIEPKMPITLAQWLDHMRANQNDKIEVSICDRTAVTPGSACAGEEDLGWEGAANMQDPFLDYEWYRLVELNKDPATLLGSSTTWMMP